MGQFVPLYELNINIDINSKYTCIKIYIVYTIYVYDDTINIIVPFIQIKLSAKHILFYFLSIYLQI